jgi:hypothetical protein
MMLSRLFVTRIQILREILLQGTEYCVICAGRTERRVILQVHSASGVICTRMLKIWRDLFYTLENVA